MAKGIIRPIGKRICLRTKGYLTEGLERGRGGRREGAREGGRERKRIGGWVRSEESAESGPRLLLWQRHSLPPSWVRKEKASGLQSPSSLYNVQSSQESFRYTEEQVLAPYNPSGECFRTRNFSCKGTKCHQFWAVISNVQPTIVHPRDSYEQTPT